LFAYVITSSIYPSLLDRMKELASGK